MIPPFEPETGNLPPGIHEATWEEFVARFDWTPERRALLGGLAAALAAAGCRRVYVGGSFVTAKARPADFDACWERAGVRLGLLDPILRRFEDGRRAQHLKYHGELFPADGIADAAGTRYREFF